MDLSMMHEIIAYHRFLKDITSAMIGEHTQCLLKCW